MNTEYWSDFIKKPFELVIDEVDDRGCIKSAALIFKD